MTLGDPVRPGIRFPNELRQRYAVRRGKVSRTAVVASYEPWFYLSWRLYRRLLAGSPHYVLESRR